MPPVSPARISLPIRYRVVGHLANGGMASVWEAHDELLKRDVAVKLLASHLGEDERARRRFQREARAAAGLSSHPNVVTIYDVGEHDGRVFMVMELMRGGSVADRLRTGEPVSHETALRWLREAAAALDAAHAAGIVHRDVKPANLLLDERGRLAIADFGIARLAWEDQVTATGQVLGTAAYISPEQAMGEPAAAASDRYALAVVAFELLTGGKPFVAEHFAAQARAHIEDPPPAASSRADDVPRAVDAVLAQGMAKRPGERFGSAAEMVDALEGALGGAVEATAPTRRLPPDPPRRPPAVAAPAPGPARAAARRRPRRTGVVLLGALAALLLLAVAGFALLGGNGGQPAKRHTAGKPKHTATPSPTPKATAKPKRTATPQRTATPTPTATATATARATPTSTPTPPPAAASSSPSALERQGHSLLAAGRAQDAVPVLARAVSACRGSTAVDPCAYAMYDYADALVRSGRPADAIPVLQERLRRFHNQDDVVRALLAKAQQAAGQASGSGNGKGKGKKGGGAGND